MTTRELLKKKMNLTDAEFVKPLPVPTKWSAPFWEGTKQGKLLLKTCDKCGNIDHPPYLYCTSCSAEEATWVEASGRAVLAAYTINMYAVPVPFIEDLPYVLGFVDLAEGPRMISNVVNCDHSDLHIGMELEAVFHQTEGGIVLPKWQPLHAKGVSDE